MTITQSNIRDLCTDAVFDRGQNYYSEGKVHERRRVDDIITATVEGSRLYDVTLSLAESDFEPSCTCPYDGAGECKHVVAVLLSLIDELPEDEGERLDTVFESIDTSELQAFVREELARDDAMLDRFFATFDATSGKSHEAYRDDVSQLFDEHTREYPVVIDAIDFSRFTDLGERYQDRGRYRQAAAVYRGLVAGIDDNIELVDGAYDHYARVFREGLDAYVECVTAADLSLSEYEAYEQFLVKRIESGSQIHREQFERALSSLQATIEE
ncbi:SWIM zinc finger domain-containing protein [Halosimplex aquaticum]|uniref:SWIM zinc finger domain-containing protein n=1 Tax=Halosimplex aquaticum TaxID=3026162 RepID=A0ABD5Y685_9EURY|nr:SWIM zinc finger family protein [Halosimplex aquaticum]